LQIFAVEILSGKAGIFDRPGFAGPEDENSRVVCDAGSTTNHDDVPFESWTRDSAGTAWERVQHSS
jgi:hypothetical protein